MQDAGYALAELLAHLVNGHQPFLYARAQQYGQYAVTLQSDFVDHQPGRLKRELDRVQPEHVALQLLGLQCLQQVVAHALLVTFVQRGRYLFAYLLV